MRLKAAKHYSFTILNFLSFLIIVECSDARSAIICDDFKSAMKNSLIKSSKYYYQASRNYGEDEVVSTRCSTNCCNDQLSHCVKPINITKKAIDGFIITSNKSISKFISFLDESLVNDTETASPSMDTANSNLSSVASLHQQNEVFKSSILPKINETDLNKRSNLKRLQQSAKNWRLRDLLTEWHLESSINPSKDQFPNFRYFKDVFMIPAAMFYCILDQHRKNNMQ